jgi:hypothetical protein
MVIDHYYVRCRGIPTQASEKALVKLGAFLAQALIRARAYLVPALEIIGQPIYFGPISSGGSVRPFNELLERVAFGTGNQLRLSEKSVQSIETEVVRPSLHTYSPQRLSQMFREEGNIMLQ